MLRRVTAVPSLFQHVGLPYPCWQARHVSNTRKKRSPAPSNPPIVLSDAQSPSTRPSSKAKASLIIPKPRTLHHNSLQTYLTHVRRTNASQTSTTYLGTRYEYLVLQHLESRLNFTLTRVGGRGDRGIDLIGTWNLPSPSLTPDQSHRDEAAEPVPVVIQTKRLSPSSSTTSAPLPAYLRALEGTLTLASSGSDALGILICTRPATEGLRKAMAASRKGLMYMCIEEMPATNSGVLDANVEHEGDSEEISTEVEKDLERAKESDVANLSVPTTRIVQILWNQAATEIALEGFSVGTSYTVDGNSDEAQLLWQGRPIRLTTKKTGLEA